MAANKRPMTERERAEDIIRHIAAAHGIELEPNVWHDPTERLPEDGKPVLVIVSGRPTSHITLHRAMLFAEYWSDEGWILEEFPEWENARPERWRKMPTPPQI